MPKKKPRKATPRKILNGSVLRAQAQALCRGKPVPKESSVIAVDAIDKLRARVAATTAWTQLAHDRLAAVLDKTLTGKRPTLGSVLTLIEALIEDHKAAAHARSTALSAERARIGDALRVILGIDQRYHTVDELLARLATEHKAAVERVDALDTELAATNELIAHLAFNLAEGDEQEQIEAASPADQRAFLTERAGQLIELSLAQEASANLEPPAPDNSTAFIESRELIESPPGILDDVHAVEDPVSDEIDEIEADMAATAEIKLTHPLPEGM